LAAGYIGLEVRPELYRASAAIVTIIALGPRLARVKTKMYQKAIAGFLIKEGIAVRLKRGLS